CERVDALAAGVAQRGGGARLALRPLGDTALSNHHLERDVQTIALVPREPYVSHASGAQRPQRSVPSQDQLLCDGWRGHVRFYFPPRRSPAPPGNAIDSIETWTRPTTTSSSTSSTTSRPRRRRPRGLARRG